MNAHRPDVDAGVEETGLVERLRRRIADLSNENERLRQSAERGTVAAIALEASPLPIVAFDADGVVTLWNRAAAMLFGWEAEEAIGMRLPFVPADRQVEFQELRQRALQGETVTEPELHRRRADGSPIVVSSWTAPLRRPDGTVCGIASIFADVSERKAADEALNRLSMAVEQAHERIVITDPRGVIQYANPAVEQATGYGRMELLGRSLEALKGDLHDEGAYGKVRDTIGQGRVWRGTFVSRRKDGSSYAEDSVISPIRDRSGRIVHFVGVSRDPLPPGKAGETHGVGTIGSCECLAGTAAHDFHNLLTAISGYCDLLLHRVPERSELRKDVEQIRRAGDRAAELTRRLLAASAPAGKRSSGR